MIKKILFVCHGNICRSPMAELLMKDLCEKEGLDLEIDSCALTSEELGNPIYPPVRKLLNEKGINTDNKYARLISKEDYEYYDLILAMDQENLYHLEYKFPNDPLNKIRLLAKDKEIEDPWYTREFERCYREILDACKGLVKELKD